MKLRTIRSRHAARKAARITLLRCKLSHLMGRYLALGARQPGKNTLLKEMREIYRQLRGNEAPLLANMKKVVTGETGGNRKELAVATEAFIDGKRVGTLISATGYADPLSELNGRRFEGVFIDEASLVLDATAATWRPQT